MQSRVFIRRSPQVCRIVKAAPSPATSRNMTLFASTSTPFLVRGAPFPSHPFASFEREVAPLFRMMEDLTRTFDHHFLPSAVNARVTPAPAPAPFQPRFDIREVNGAYELRGELPGVESNNIEVEFTEAQTLVIRGRTESENSSGTPPAEVQGQAAPKAVEATEPTTTTTNAVADDAASTHSTSSYQKATVEDEGAESATSTPGQATPAESITSETPQQGQTQVNAQATPAESANTNTSTAADTTAQAPHYWMTERRTGSFRRAFTFPGKINQEAVTATLKNGVLNVVVPKAVPQQARRISVQ